MSRELNTATKYRVWEYKVIVFICLHSSSKLGRAFKSGVSKVKGPSEILNYQYFDHVIKNIKHALCPSEISNSDSLFLFI